MKLLNTSSVVLLGDVFILVITLTDQVCPNGFVMHTNYTNKCYKISEGDQKWSDSVTYCDSYGASVAYVYNEVIHNFVTGLFTSQTRILIALKSVSGQYVWLDDQALDWSKWSGALLSYTVCVVYRYGVSGWEWYEHPCNSPSYVLCEYTINDGTQKNTTLVGGTNITGRAEVYYNNRWGTICHSNPENRLGYVICDALGLGFQSFLSSLPGTGPTWLKDINCGQGDTDLNQCVVTSGGNWGSNSNCHSNDIRVSCSEKTSSSVTQYGAYLEPSSDTYIYLPTSDVTSGSSISDMSNTWSDSTNSLLLYPSTSCTESLSSVLVTSSFCVLSTFTVTESITTTVTVHSTPSYSDVSTVSKTISASATVSTQLNTVTQSSVVTNGYSVLPTGHFDRRTSAMYSVATKYDMRPSAIAVGTIGIIGLLFPIVLIIISDVLTISKNLKQMQRKTKQHAKTNHKKYKQSHNELSGSVSTMGVMETSTPPVSHIMPRRKDIIHVKSPALGLEDSLSGKQTRFTRL